MAAGPLVAERSDDVAVLAPTAAAPKGGVAQNASGRAVPFLFDAGHCSICSSPRGKDDPNVSCV
jgi:hypothetical protein